MGKLFIVATPIGNIADITLRAIETLKNSDAILAEDTRTAKKLLAHYGIHNKRLISFFEGNEERKTPEIIDQLLKPDNRIGIVSESGMPLISDPGYKLVREAISLGIPVEVIPGPTALITALVVSGLPPNAFIFLGYLPKKDGRAKNMLVGLKKVSDSMVPVKTAVIYESPHRLLRTLKLIKEIFGNEEIVIARELTKLHEEILRENVDKLIARFEEETPRGEFVVLFRMSK